MDAEGARDAEVFPAVLRAAIEASDRFVFVISPDSVNSRFCAQEVERAVEPGKRIVPLALRRVDDERIPDLIRVRNWIPVGTAEFRTRCPAAPPSARHRPRVRQAAHPMARQGARMGGGGA